MDALTRATASGWLEERRPAVVVQVLQSQGSVPREPGTRMLVARDRTAGTVGGGHLELQAIARAREMLRTGELNADSQVLPLGPALGQCCGGTVTLGYHALDAAALAQWPVPAPLFELQLHGGGHVGRAVATLLTTLNCQVDWIDERDDAFGPWSTLGTAWPSHIRRIAVDAVEAEVDRARAGAFYLVLTHSHELDLRIMQAILHRADFGFLGLIGSKTKRQRFLHRFERLGIPASLCSRICCPIGVADIPGKAPEIVAVAVVAQLLAHC